MASPSPSAPSGIEPRPTPRPPDYRPPAPDLVEHTVAALTDPALEPIVEFVVTADADAYDVRAVDGRVRFRRTPDGTDWRFEDLTVLPAKVQPGSKAAA